MQVASRLQEVLNRLQKSRVERFPNLSAEKEAYEAEERAERKEAERARRKEEVATERERRREAEARSYSHLQEPEKMVTNSELAEKYASVEDAEDDFM